MLVSTIINIVGIHIHSFSFFSFLMKIRYQNRSPVFFICLPKWLGFSMCILPQIAFNMDILVGFITKLPLIIGGFFELG